MAEAKLIALACGPAPPRHAKWTLRLLEDKAVQLHIDERASDNIERTLKKTFSSRAVNMIFRFAWNEITCRPAPPPAP